MPVRNPVADIQELNRQIKDIGIGVLIFLVIPLVVIGFSQGWGYWQSGILIALALFGLGVFIGFLFGVPKVAAPPSKSSVVASST